MKNVHKYLPSNEKEKWMGTPSVYDQPLNSMANKADSLPDGKSPLIINRRL